LCLGVAYKPNVDDMRESPSFPVMDKLEALGAEVVYYDPFIPVIPPTREHQRWTGVESVKWTPEELHQADAVLILTHHKGVDYKQLYDQASLIIDTRGVMRQLGITDDEKVWTA